MLLIPNRNPIENLKEQRQISIDWETWPDKLRFQYRRAWDKDYISRQEFIQYVQNKHPDSYIGIVPIEESLFQKEDHFWGLITREYKENRFLIKRLYPDTSFYRSLVSCISSKLITEKAPYSDSFLSEADIEDKKKAYLYLLEFYSGSSIYTAVQSKLESRNIFVDLNTIHQKIDQRILTRITTTANKFDSIHEYLLTADYKAFEALLKSDFGDILHPICTKAFLDSHRKKLASWTLMAEQGQALFVHAPMGIGKTYSIAEGLASNPDKSAVVFMPTKKLCLDLRYKLAEIISLYLKKFPTQDDKIPLSEDISQWEFDENYNIIDQYREKYYEDRGIYLFDGINEKECLHYQAIIDRYKSGYYRKKDICDKCNKRDCRFITHKKVLNQYRIIITTHFMYDFFYHSADHRRWKPLSQGEKRLRDYFIIDEDFILTNCYQPISLTEQKLAHFIITLTEFFNNRDYISDQVDKKCFQNTDLLLGLAAKTTQNSVIPPIGPNFRYPISIKTSWELSLKEQGEIVPDEVIEASQNKFFPIYVGDYLSVLENAIRKGFVVQTKDNNKTILLPNPREYHIRRKKLPAHIFFDGTKLENRYIRKKLKAIRIKTMDIRIGDLLWDVKVYQNLNTDLPLSKSNVNLPKIKQALCQIIDKHGPHERFFIVTKKNIKDEIQEFLLQKIKKDNFVIEYFGNLRGLNTAQRCNVGIILGSLILPDTIETAMSLDYIHRHLQSFPPCPRKIYGNLWDWKDSTGTRQYKEEFLEIEAFSKTYRHSEYRQALARTRYLSHPVTFYIFSKERIDSYEPFIKRIEDQELFNDIFPPSPRHPNNTYEMTQQLVFEWLKTNQSVSATDLFTHYPNMRRQTIGKHLKEMKEKGMIRFYKKYKNRYCNGVIM